jgi:glycosyltransferase involved in cell wall biosynthesis
MKWLFVAADAWPMSNGTALRVWNLCRSLRAMGEEVAVLSDVADSGFRPGYEEIGVTVHHAAGGTSIRRSRWDSYDEHTAITRELTARSGDCDVVVLSAASSLQYADSVAPGAFLAADMIDDPILENRRRFWRTSNPLRWIRRLRWLVELRWYERSKIDSAGVVFFVSDADRESFGRRNPAVCAFTSPNGVDLEYWGPVADSPVAASSKDVVFVGNFSFLPNLLAGKTLIRRIAPHVWKTHPDARFRLVGADPSAVLAGLRGPRVELAGRVPDVRPYLKAAAVVCIPMTAGTGIKNKFLEAWAAARPVVATPLACQGLPAAHERNALIASTPRGLAQQICRLLENAGLQTTIADAGCRAARDNFSWARIAREFLAAVVKVRDGRHGS